MLSLDALQAAADENLAAHASWATSHLPTARIQSSPELVVVDSGLACDTFNFIARARLTESTAEGRIRAAIDLFTAVGRPFSWWLGPGYTPSGLPDLLIRAGLHEAETEVAMAMDLRDLPDTPPAVEELRITRVLTRTELAAFADLAAANWDPPDQDVWWYYAEGASQPLVAEDAPRRLYLGFLEGQPVATAEATTAAGVVGLYNIATRPEARGRGIALAMTHTALSEAARSGIPTAILQASAAGVGVYERMGFREFGIVTEFKP